MRAAFRPRATILVAALVVAGCSHSRPFIRGPATTPAPAAARIDHRLILIGDAGDADPDDEPALDLLEQRVRVAPERTTVVFLGDNVYETGMPDPTELEGTAIEAVLDEVLLNLYQSRRDSERLLKAQVKAVRVPGARAIFIPGNHDWDQFGVGGFKRVLNQQTYINQLRTANQEVVDVTMLPRDGCPGPTALDLGTTARLIVIDTQWWLDLGVGGKPTPEHNPTACPYVTKADILAALQTEIEKAGAAGREVVVAGHHPLASRGPHGGHVDLEVHLFPLTMLGTYVPFVVRWTPLPILGSIAAWLRSNRSPSGQDFSGPGNAELRDALAGAMAKAAADGAQPILYAAGHDHSLQVFKAKEGPRWTVVSGLGSSSKASGVRHDGHTTFAHSDTQRPGLMEVDFADDGRARLAVIEWSPERKGGEEVYAVDLTAMRK
jgi:hypothetical protein